MKKMTYFLAAAMLLLLPSCRFVKVNKEVLDNLDEQVDVFQGGSEKITASDNYITRKDTTGEFHAIQIAFTGRENDLGGHVELLGDRAACTIDSGYLTADDHVMDINYYVNHVGKECDTNIYTSGVLRDKCYKVFRTTIDFQPGAVKSSGEENENVLLMNDGVTNKTVPTILCGEEDVAGEHGCTVGRLADDLIFYLESRGIPNEEIYEMMAKARLEATIRKIPDEKFSEELVEFNNNL